ncbi:MFS transporter [Agaricicola taiwanensis]|uniref:MFS transporter n=2 Tax=Agaricicola taiwanensis TaxID=591372 RepID=A0A8J2W3U5_9RHOB|nr:MFS transporter [Agaricicola taiwanensis]
MRLAPTVATAVAVQAMASAAVLALAPIAPIVAADLDLSPHLIGYQVSLIYLFATIASLFAGAVAGKFGAGTASQFAMAAVAAGLIGLACGWAPGMALASAVIGVGYSLTNPAASEALNRVTPPSARNLVFSIKQTGVPIGGMIAAIVLPVLAVRYGWRVTVAVAAIPALVLAFGLLSVRGGWNENRNPAVSFRANVKEGLALVLGSAPLRALSLMSFLYSATQLSLVSFAVTMLVGEFGWTPVSAGFAAAAIQAAGVAGRLIWGGLADKFDAGVPVLAATGGLATLCAVAMPAIGSFPDAFAIVLLMMMSLASVGWNGVMLAEAARLSPPARAGAVAGGVLMLTFAGVVAGPALFALLYRVLESYSQAYAVFATAPLIGAVVILRAHRRIRRAAQ